MNEIDELKLQWSQTSLRIDQLEQDNARLTEELRESKMLPTLHRLAGTYRNMMIIGWCMLAITYPFFFIFWPNIWPTSVVTVAVLWVVVFALCVVEDTYLYLGVKAIDVSTMSVEEVSRRALKCRKIHLIGQSILIPIVVVFLWVLYVQAPEGRWGMLIGGLIGGAFGLHKWLQIMRAYRSLI